MEVLRKIAQPLMQKQATPEKRLVFVGTRTSSKTTALGCLDLTCDILSAQDPNFTHFIDEKTSGICQVPSDLCRGFFPEPTPPGLIYEADEIMRWKTPLGEKTVCLPFCETAGEDIENLMGPYTKNVYQQNQNYMQADNLNKYICDSNGYVLVMPVSRAQIPGTIPMDEETDEIQHDPDVNIRRILAAIYRYKKESRSPPIEGIAVLLAKYDMIDSVCKSRGMDLYNPEGARLFLETYFRQTSSLLKYYGLSKVKFFPVHVQVEKVRLPDGKIGFAKWPGTNKYKILTDPVRNLPLYSEASFKSLVAWIKDTFAK